MTQCEVTRMLLWLSYYCCYLLAVSCVAQEETTLVDNVEQPTCQGMQLPKDCHCFRDDWDMATYICNCSRRSWTFVHKGFPISLEKLILWQNNIRALKKYSFSGCNTIGWLDISYNNLTSIDEGTFDELTRLTRLFVQNNLLKFSDSSSVPNFMLQNNRKLEILFMDGNQWEKETVYNSNLFTNLYKLLKLKMDSIEGAVFDDNFKNLKSLSEFWLSGGINTIKNDTFKNFSELKHIKDLAFLGGKVEHIDELGFSYFPQLKTLDLSNNKDLSLEGFRKSIPGLVSTRIEVLTLSNIETDPTAIYEEFYYQLRNLTHLKEVYLSMNNIIRVDFKNICEHIPNLDKLNIEINQINRVDNLNYIGECRKCSTISAEHQSNKVALEYYAQRVIILPPNVRHIILYDAFAFTSIRHLYIEGGNELRTVDLKYNGISYIVGPILFRKPCNPSKSQGILVDLRSNGIVYINQNGIDKSISRCIRTLELSNNKLGQYISKLNGSFFQYYDTLERLYLSTNGITFIQPDLFAKLRLLKKLYLRNNHLRSLFEIDGFSPTYLELAENNIGFLTPTDCKALEKANDRTTLRVDLNRNKFVCTCESYFFLRWLNNTRVYITRWQNNSKCGELHINNETLPNDILPRLSFRCHIQVGLIVGGCTLLGVIVTGLLVVCLYRKRWCLKYWCIKATRNRKRHQLLREQDTRDLYSYDAFVMYCADDSSWVANHLAPNLETQEREEIPNNTENTAFKLCIHQRDFLGGVDISENIVQAVDSSFKCLLILSRKFCQSEWTHFEVQMARTRSNAEGRNVIIVIRLEDVPLSEMSTSLIYLLQNHTYIDYPDSPEERPEFWDKVKRAIKDSC